MNKDQNKDHSNEEKGRDKDVGGKVTGDKSKEHKDKADNPGGKDGTVLRDINGPGKK